MPEQDLPFGGGLAENVLSPIVLAGMILTILLIFVLPRRYVVVAMLPCIFLVPLGQQLYIGGVHWFVYRIIVLTALVRLIGTKVVSQKKLMAGGFNLVDRAFLGYVLFEAIATVLLYMQQQALLNQCGFLIDFLGGYIVLRCLIRDEEDSYRLLKCLAFITVILAISMVREQVTSQNIFGLLGGVRLVPDIREGRIRSQGSFQHAILAGVFGATLIPLFCLLWKNGKSKAAAGIGLLSASIITYTSQSSTPLLAYAASMLGICLWPVRKNMRLVRWGIVVAVLLLAMVMKAPVWFVIMHIDLVGGSGYHRAMLVDEFIRHFSSWWLIGTKEAGTWNWDMWDVQNQYVDAGERGGIAAFILFIVLISGCFAKIGDARKALETDKDREWYFWFLGSALFANCVAFIGSNYYDQIKVSWFLLLATILATTAPILQSQATKDAETEIERVNAHFSYGLPSPSPSQAIATNAKFAGRRKFNQQSR